MKKEINTPLEEVVQEQKAPEKKVVKRTYYFEVFLVALIFSFGLLAFFAKQTPYFPFDIFITKTVQQITLPGFHELMIFITTLGNFEWGIFTIIMLFIFFVIIRKNILAIFLALSVVGSEILSVTFKAVIARPRPDPELITQLGKHLYSDSFPSGHVLFYIGCYGFLLFLSFAKLKHGLLRIILTIVLTLMLIFIGLSRIYVGAHWFSDVLGAYLIGSVWLLVVIYLYNKFGKKMRNKYIEHLLFSW
jgi:membrane-associated phospholipid phosphatase